MAERSMAGVDLSEYHASNNIMIFGPIGCGKTAFGASSPNSLVWNCEPGIMTAKRMKLPAKVLHIASWQDAWDSLDTLESSEPDDRWHVIDTLSTLENKGMRQVLDEMVERNPKRDPDLPDRAEHQLRQNRVKRFVERMVDTPANTIWLAHQMKVETESGDIEMLPSISGGADKGWPVANYIMGLMNAVGFMDWKDTDSGRVNRILWERYTKKLNKNVEMVFNCKNQYEFGMYTDNWDLPTMIEAIGDEPKPATTARRRRAAQ